MIHAGCGGGTGGGWFQRQGVKEGRNGDGEVRREAKREDEG